MGQAKALLDWHGETAVEHAVAVVREGIGWGPVCVVRAPGQELPPSPYLIELQRMFRGSESLIKTSKPQLSPVPASS